MEANEEHLRHGRPRASCGSGFSITTVIVSAVLFGSSCRYH